MHRPADASHGLLEVHSCVEASVNVNPILSSFPFPGASGPYLVRIHLDDDRGVRRRAQLAQPHHPAIPALQVDRLEPGAGTVDLLRHSDAETRPDLLLNIITS